jgi:Zinc-finger domain of monoamine-oxidase A repressor R1
VHAGVPLPLPAQSVYAVSTPLVLYQCRQKTVEVKAKCTSCTLWWCPRCLLNRYGEEVEAVAALKDWRCPRCRSLCNCSNCRKVERGH